MPPNHKDMRARLVIWALAGATIAVVWLETAWVQS
jgi:hypothetical protein